MILGILSGIGAAAGAYFYKMLIRKCQKLGAKEDRDFPEVILYNLPFTGTNQMGIESSDQFKADLQKGIVKLNMCGATKIVITCNTAYLYAEQLQEISNAKIVNMVEITKKFCQGHKYGVLCSRTAKERNLFDTASYHTTELQQIIIDELIQKAITDSTGSADKDDMAGIIENMFNSGAERVVLGCTELPLILRRGELVLLSNLYSKIVDAGECTIDEILKGFIP